MAVDDRVSSKLFNSRDHLANERTFLAWVRTALGTIAFGIAIERFAFFDPQESTFSEGLSHLAGFSLVALGVLITAFAFIRFRTIEKELDEGTYKPNLLLTTALAFFIIALGILLFWVVLT